MQLFTLRKILEIEINYVTLKIVRILLRISTNDNQQNVTIVGHKVRQLWWQS